MSTCSNLASGRPTSGSSDRIEMFGVIQVVYIKYNMNIEESSPVLQSFFTRSSIVPPLVCSVEETMTN